MTVIDIFVWNERFNTGLPEIDRQHQRLMELLNRVAAMSACGAEPGALQAVLDELVEYTDYHFRTEEALWTAHLGGLEREHLQLHRVFSERLHRLLRPQPGGLVQVTEELLVFLVRWLTGHILEDDRRFAQIVLGLQQGLPLAQAQAQAEAQLGEGARLMIEIILAVCGSLSSNSLRLMHELSERKENERRLSLAASVFEHANEGIMITDAEGRILEVNAAFTRITGYGHDEAVGQNARLLKSGRHGPEFYAAMWRALHETGAWSGEIWGRRRSGELFAKQQTISAVRGPDGELLRYVALFADITMVKDQQRQLEHVAFHDPLTHLPNRVLLSDRLQQAIARARRLNQTVAVAYLDLDDFKRVNERLGPLQGDRLLVQLAERMRQMLRACDTLARFGGDEFVAVLPELPQPEAALPILERLLAQIALPLELDGASLSLTASLGVSFLHEAEADADQLLRQADQAMFQAKRSGRNRLQVFDAAEDRVLRDRHGLLDRLRLALQRQEFVLHYQPKVHMRNGQVVGAEALIRWQHPQRGLLPPAQFLGVVEGHPLALNLGEWVLETALSQIEAWRTQGLELPLSINVGASQLGREDFVERLRAALARHPLVRAGDLEIEVLESSALDDIARVSELIDACRALGVGFALDDFGTGYSSLAYLKRLSAERLKIDQSFVRDMLDDPDDLAILDGVLGLAAAFHREVIAEGVETEAHGAMLLRMGCELAQGYAIARPLPAADLPAWCRDWQPPQSWRHCQRLERERLPLLSAMVELRAWLKRAPDGRPPPRLPQHADAELERLQQQLQGLALDPATAAAARAEPGARILQRLQALIEASA